MLPERDRVFVAQMIEAANAALEFTDGPTKESLGSDRLIAFAVVRAIQLVGQAARNVSTEVQTVNRDIPWKEMIAMRNVGVHDYADVDLALVWRTVREDLPKVIARLQALLGESTSR
jgi:uncharacterized protein with HEPN domain